MCAYIELNLGNHNSSVANKQMLTKKEKSPLQENPPMLVTVYLLNDNPDTKIPIAINLAGSNFITNILKKHFLRFYTQICNK